MTHARTRLLARPGHRPALLALLLAAALPPRALAATPLVSFEDVEDRAAPAPAFDLRRLAVLRDGDDLLLVVTLGEALPPEGLTRQAVELYLDSDPAPGRGAAAALPGRRVAFAGGRTWETVVVLRPAASRAAARLVPAPAGARVVVPDGLLARGRTVSARLPAAAVGGVPDGTWGFSALVLEGDEVRDVLLPAGEEHGKALAALKAGEVATVPFVTGSPLLLPPEAEAAPSPQPSPPRSGGEGVNSSRSTSTPASASTPTSTAISGVGVQPPLPSGERAGERGAQPAGTLGALPLPSGERAGERGAASPSVSLSPNLMPRLSAAPAPAAAAQAAPAPAPLLVTELTGELLSAKGPVKGLQAMQFGRVVDAQGITVARVMVLRLLDEALLATVIAGKERIKPGQAVLFDPPGKP